MWNKYFTKAVYWIHSTPPFPNFVCFEFDIMILIWKCSCRIKEMTTRVFCGCCKIKAVCLSSKIRVQTNDTDFSGDERYLALEVCIIVMLWDTIQINDLLCWFVLPLPFTLVLTLADYLPLCFSWFVCSYTKRQATTVWSAGLFSPCLNFLHAPYKPETKVRPCCVVTCTVSATDRALRASLGLTQKLHLPQHVDRFETTDCDHWHLRPMVPGHPWNAIFRGLGNSFHTGMTLKSVPLLFDGSPFPGDLHILKAINIKFVLWS